MYVKVMTHGICSIHLFAQYFSEHLLYSRHNSNYQGVWQTPTQIKILALMEHANSHGGKPVGSSPSFHVFLK